MVFSKWVIQMCARLASGRVRPVLAWQRRRDLGGYCKWRYFKRSGAVLERCVADQPIKKVRHGTTGNADNTRRSDPVQINPCDAKKNVATQTARRHPLSQK
jgi:hypothetical protein